MTRAVADLLNIGPQFVSKEPTSITQLVVNLQVHHYVHTHESADFPILNQMADASQSTSEEEHHQMRKSNAAHTFFGFFRS